MHNMSRWNPLKGPEPAKAAPTMEMPLADGTVAEEWVERAWLQAITVLCGVKHPLLPLRTCQRHKHGPS